MPLLSEIVVQELLKDGNTYANRYALSIKIAGKDLTSTNMTLEEKAEVNKILKTKGICILLS